jgi:aspartyl/asparaginyl-tRNA synthetase
VPWGLPVKGTVYLTDTSQVIEFCKSRSNLNAEARLHGLITRVVSLHRITFFDLFDGLDSIQVVAEKKNFSRDDWTTIRSIKNYTRLIVEGQVLPPGKYKRCSVLLKKIPTIEPPLKPLESESSPLSQERVAFQILLAELKNRASDLLAERGFLEVEPHLLSTLWSKSLMQPLRVTFPGFGHSATYMAVSPAPQLIRALVVTGRDKVFCFSHCFTTTFRDEVASSESPLIMAQMLRTDLNSTVNLAKDLLRALLKGLSDQTISTLVSGTWLQKKMEWPPVSAQVDLQIPQVHIFEMIDNSSNLSGSNLSLFKICWPRKSTLVEGGLQMIGEQVTWGFITIHLERIAPLFRSADFRRIANLSPSIQKGGTTQI